MELDVVRDDQLVGGFDQTSTTGSHCCVVRAYKCRCTTAPPNINQRSADANLSSIHRPPACSVGAAAADAGIVARRRGGARGGAVRANGRLGIFLRRSRLLEDSFDAMAAVPVVDWARGVVVHFAGENGMDYGVLTRDWLVQTLEALANPAIALFTSVSSASLTHPSPASLVQPRYNEYFLLFGRLLGKAFLEDIPVTVRLSKLVLKALLGREDGALVDLEGFDAELHRNLVWMLDNDITDVIEETFCTTVSVLGKTETVDLV